MSRRHHNDVGSNLRDKPIASSREPPYNSNHETSVSRCHVAVGSVTDTKALPLSFL